MPVEEPCCVFSGVRSSPDEHVALTVLATVYKEASFDEVINVGAETDFRIRVLLVVGEVQLCEPLTELKTAACADSEWITPITLGSSLREPVQVQNELYRLHEVSRGIKLR